MTKYIIFLFGIMLLLFISFEKCLKHHNYILDKMTKVFVLNDDISLGENTSISSSITSKRGFKNEEEELSIDVSDLDQEVEILSQNSTNTRTSNNCVGNDDNIELQNENKKCNFYGS